MARAFTVEAMALCEQRGHQWAWRSGWGGRGFHECRRCGESGPILEAGAAPPADALPAAPVVEEPTAPSRSRSVDRVPVVAPRDAEMAARLPVQQRNAEIIRRRAAGESTADLAVAFNLHITRIGQIVAESKRPPRQFRGPRPGQNVARDAEIVRRRQAGESPSLLAAEFGLHPSRIPQIVRSGTAAAVTP